METKNHRDCRKFIVAKFAALGIDVIATTAPPTKAYSYVAGSICPHGQAFWCEPTDKQIEQWAKEREL